MTNSRDVDFVHFDPGDLREDGEDEIQSRLKEFHDAPWEVINQARVHLWYEERFGRSIDPFESTAQGIASWPETATCVGVRLLNTDALEIVAPFGLEDLFGLLLRRNPSMDSGEAFHRRLAEKRFLERWPKLKLVE